MKNKKLVTSLATLLVVLVASLGMAYAHGGGFGGGMSCPTGRCGMGGGGFHHGGFGGYGHGSGKLDTMFFFKAHFILENKDALGLTDDKVQEIKNLKLETMKSLIKQNADIAITCIDLKSKLKEYPIDTVAVNKLVDQKYDLKKAKTKGLVDALAKLKGTLTKEQYDKLHQLFKGGPEKGPGPDGGSK